MFQVASTWSKSAALSSGASSGSIQIPGVLVDFSFIGFSHADDAARIAARRPNNHGHSVVKKTDADHALLAVIAPNIGKVIGRPSKHFGSIGEVDTSVQQHQLALRFIPRQFI